MESVNLKEFHWMMDMLHSIDVGLVVIDRENRVQMWNRFMANHSGAVASEVIGKDLLSTFPYIPRKWLEKKIETVVTLRNRAFTTWEQRPYLFRFRNYRPITGTAELGTLTSLHIVFPTSRIKDWAEMTLFPRP